MTTIEQILSCPTWRYCILAFLALACMFSGWGVALIWREERRYRDYRKASKAIRNGRKP